MIAHAVTFNDVEEAASRATFGLSKTVLYYSSVSVEHVMFHHVDSVIEAVKKIKLMEALISPDDAGFREILFESLIRIYTKMGEISVAYLELSRSTGFDDDRLYALSVRLFLDKIAQKSLFFSKQFYKLLFDLRINRIVKDLLLREMSGALLKYVEITSDLGKHSISFSSDYTAIPGHKKFLLFRGILSKLQESVENFIEKYGRLSFDHLKMEMVKEIRGELQQFINE